MEYYIGRYTRTDGHGGGARTTASAPRRPDRLIITLLLLLLLLLRTTTIIILRTNTAEYGRPPLDPPARPSRRPGRSKYLKYFNRRPGGSTPRPAGSRDYIRSKILSFHITHCDGYHTKAIKGSDNGSQTGPNSNRVCSVYLPSVRISRVVYYGSYRNKRPLKLHIKNQTLLKSILPPQNIRWKN